MTRDELEKKIPKSYKDAMNDRVLAEYITHISIWGKLIDLGFVKDFEEVEEYMKNLYENGIREMIIREALK